MTTYTPNQIREILRQQKLKEERQRKAKEFFESAKRKFLQEQELRRQKEIWRQSLARAKAKLKPKPRWGNKVW